MTLKLIVTLALTLVMVRYGLMALTNFNLGNIGYLYEDMATSILATPKAYIILVTTAFLASRMNLYYGWDFNGILIPSLLALQWYQPVKILATVVESCVILWVAMLVLKLPVLNKMTIEGARKLLLFFNISFAYKFLLGYGILYWFPSLKVTDYFGFGYLLSTLMALKIHDKAIFARLTRATLQTSLVAVVIANFIGFSLTLLPISELFGDSKAAYLPPAFIKPMAATAQDLTTLLRQEQIELYQSKLTAHYTPPLPFEIEAFTQAIKHLHAYLENPKPLYLKEALVFLDKIHYRLETVNNGRYIVLHEQPNADTLQRGWGVYILDTQAVSKLAIEIPASLDEAGIFDAGLGLFYDFNATSLAISGSSRKKSTAEESADVLKNNRSFFQVFHSLINRHDVLQVRTYSTEMARQMMGVRPTTDAIELKKVNSSVWIQERLPESLNLARLKSLIHHFDLHWTAPPFLNVQRELSNYGFAELILSPEALRKLWVNSLLLNHKAGPQKVEAALQIEGYLQEWILNRKPRIAEKGSQRYVVPKPEELLFFDEQVLTPLLKIVRQTQLQTITRATYQDELQIIAGEADTMGYSLIQYRNTLNNEEYFLLAEQDDGKLRHWGLYVFRLNKGRPYSVQIPRPLFEINTFEYGIDLFERLKAEVLMIATTHPDANLNGSADLINPTNKLSVFNLVNQVMLREARESEFMSISVRAFTYQIDKPFPKSEVIFSLAEGIVSRTQLTGLPHDLVTHLENSGLKVQLIDGSEETSGYEVGSSAQSSYLDATTHKQFAILWLSPTVRASYRQQSENMLQAAQFSRFNIQTQEQTLSSYLTERQGFSVNVSLDDSFFKCLSQYITDLDIMRLQQAVSLGETQGYRLSRVLDRNSKQAFVVVKNKAGVPIALANLAPGDSSRLYVDTQLPLATQVLEFINQRKAWLLHRPD